MRRLQHILLSPACRLVRLALGEKKIGCQLAVAEDPLIHLPVFTDFDGTTVIGLWAIVDHLESENPENPLVPLEAEPRAEAFRLLDWIMGAFHEEVTKRIVFEKASQAQTGNPLRRAPSMETVRLGRQALKGALAKLAPLAEQRGFLACRDVTLADLALAAHLSALDYYGEVPWAEHPAIAEWYTRMKSRPSFRSLLADRVPGQPPVAHYAELDF
ncbi:MAG TPA: glutathione S-transferase family protein [Micropepsaceae bacterium]|jgi:glutathione S-transferase|nr:glutathione S-transferase family protein [Micropepsaceae bacterium]